MLILCNLPAVSSDCWKDIIEENVKAVDRSWSRQSFLWIHILHSGYLAAIVCGVSGSNPLKRTVRARRIVSFLFFFQHAIGQRGENVVDQRAQWFLDIGEKKYAYSPNTVATIRFAG